MDLHLDQGVRAEGRRDMHDEPLHSAFSEPLDGRTAARLLLHGGASQLRLRVDPTMTELFRARFVGPIPRVETAGDSVTIRHRRLSLSEWARLAFTGFDHDAEVTLNAAIPWEIVITGGLSDLDADLGAGRVSGLEVRGGASNVVLVLPRPSGAVAIRIGGGASQVELRRPVDVGFRVQIGGGISRLELDDQSFGAIGGHASLSTPNLGADRYELHVRGGVSHVSVGAE